MRHLSDFNKLGLGTTQHSTTVYVYNKKRVGDFELDEKTYSFRIRKYPKKQTDEYLLVDMLNSLNKLGIDSTELLKTLENRLPQMGLNKALLLGVAEKCGKNWVKRYIRKQDKLHDLSA